MKWNDWVSILFPVLLKVVGWLIPAVGGFLSGPIGWLVSFGLAKLTALLADWAERAARFSAIHSDILAQVAEVNEMAKAFFLMEDRRERGEVIPQEERNAAKQKLRDSARKLIRINKPEPEPEPEPPPEEPEPESPSPTDNKRTIVRGVNFSTSKRKRVRKRRDPKP